MTTVATNYEVTSSPPMIGPSTILPTPTPTDASRLQWRAMSQRNCKPPKTSRIRTSKRFGFQPPASLWQRKPGAAGLKAFGRGMIPGSASIETVHDHRAGWHSSGLGDVEMLVNFSGLMAHVQANMVLLSVAVALGSLILATLLLLGVS